MAAAAAAVRGGLTTRHQPTVPWRINTEKTEKELPLSEQSARITALDTYDIRFPTLDELCADPGALSRELNGDSQLRWLGPENEHFEDPAVVREGHYTDPLAPGFSATMKTESIAAFRYPDGHFWQADLAQQADALPQLEAAL